MRNEHLLASGVLAIAVMLAGCTAADTAAGDPASTDAPTGSSVAAAEPPASCVDLDLDPAAAVAGDALGTCLADGLQLAGTLRSTQFSAGTVTGHADVVLTPAIAIASTSNIGGTPLEVRYVDGQTWADLGEGWVRGDAASNDPEEILVAQAGQLALAMMSPQAIADGIASCPSWHALAQRETLEAEGGPEPDAVVIVCDGTLTVAGIEITDAAVYFSEDWLPLGDRGTGSFLGVSTPFAVHYYDHGAAIVIDPPH